MWRPTHPLPGCDVFVLNDKDEVLLIRRSDNRLWALPGGCQELSESPKECAERECLEESGYSVKVTDLLGVFSSTKYDYVHYPHKHVQFCHILYSAEIVSGNPRHSDETCEVSWFSLDNLPELSDGHEIRVRFGFKSRVEKTMPFFE